MCAGTLCAASSPADELSRAVSSATAAHAAHDAIRDFLQAWCAVVVHAPAAKLGTYVTAAVQSRPDLAAKIVESALVLRVEPKAKAPGDTQLAMILTIVRAAIAAQPSSAGTIVAAAMRVHPEAAAAILVVANEVAPGRRYAASEGRSARPITYGWTQGTGDDNASGLGSLNFANLDAPANRDIRSPEKPPAHGGD